MSANRQLILGLFFVVVFGVLGWFTLFKSDFSLFRESHPMVVHFNQAGGLKAGDSVRVAGMKWGQVNSMTFDPAADDSRRVTVELLLDRELTLYTDAVIEIQEASVLGGKVLAIEPGQSNLGPMPSDEPLYGEVQQNVMESLSNLVQENRDSLASILENLERTIVDLREGNGALTRLLYSEDLADDLAAAVSSISGTFENAEALTEQLRSEDRGTLGKLIYEDAAYQELESLLSEGRGLVAELQSGEGTIAALVSDPDLAGRVRSLAERLDSIATGLDEGQGTLGLLLEDPEIANRLKSIVTRLDEGEGTLGKLLSDEEVYEDVRKTAQNLADATDALNLSEGTLGRLLNDDELYLQLEKAVTVLVGSLEEAREAAPISTFLNTVFLGF